jgi:patatin-related protein
VGQPTCSKHIGLTFYGGVSLAVFEAGIAYELIRAVQFCRQNKRRDGVPDLHVDVLTGTSAGGLAAFQVAAALAGRDPEAVLRRMIDLWVNTADIETLTARAVENGFLDNGPLRLGAGEILDAALGNSAAGASNAPLEAEMDLVLTLTNLDGLGEPVILDRVEPNSRKRHALAFPTARYVEYERFGSDDVLDRSKHERLVDAAVITAGFPVAFPPTRKTSSYIAGADAETEFTYVDGGLMDNRPLGVALDYIAKRPAEQRWFLFIDPNEVWVDPTYGSIMTAEGERDPVSIARRLFGVARSDTIFDDLKRVGRIFDALGIMHSLRDAMLEDERTLQVLALGERRQDDPSDPVTPASDAAPNVNTPYSEIVARDFNEQAWALWMLICPHLRSVGTHDCADDQAEEGDPIRRAWCEVRRQERLRLAVRMREYVRHLTRAHEITEDDRADLLSLIDNPQGSGRRPPCTWSDYYGAVRGVTSLDPELRQLRYRAWRKIQLLKKHSPPDADIYLDADFPADLIAAIRNGRDDHASPADPTLAGELERDNGDRISRDIAEQLTRLNERANELARSRIALRDFFIDAIAERTKSGAADHLARFQDYAKAMQVLESLSGVSYTPSMIVQRITPFDIYDEATDKTSQKPLAGGELAAFGGFLDKGWRLNDFLVGRLTMRRLLERPVEGSGERVFPEALFRRVAEHAPPEEWDYLTWCDHQDRALVARLDEGSAERDMLTRFCNENAMPPYSGDSTKPSYLLPPHDMALTKLATPKLSATLRKLSNSLLYLTHRSASREAQPYRSLRPLTRSLNLMFAATDAGVRMNAGRDRGPKVIIARLQGLLAVLVVLVLILIYMVLGHLDREDFWPFVALPGLAIGAVAWRVSAWLGKLKDALSSAPAEQIHSRTPDNPAPH